MAVPFVALAKNGGARENRTPVPRCPRYTSTTIVYFNTSQDKKLTKKSRKANFLGTRFYKKFSKN